MNTYLLDRKIHWRINIPDFTTYVSYLDEEQVETW